MLSEILCVTSDIVFFFVFEMALLVLVWHRKLPHYHHITCRFLCDLVKSWWYCWAIESRLELNHWYHVKPKFYPNSLKGRKFLNITDNFCPKFYPPSQKWNQEKPLATERWRLELGISISMPLNLGANLWKKNLVWQLKIVLITTMSVEFRSYPGKILCLPDMCTLLANVDCNKLMLP